MHQVIIDAIQRERDYQDAKWGTVEENPHSIFQWANLIDEELLEASRSIDNGRKLAALREILQVAVVCVACLEQHGIVERPHDNGGKHES